MLQVRKDFAKIQAERVIEALEKNGFTAMYIPTSKEAVEKILEMIPKEAKVGVGGSVTIREMGLFDALVARGNKVIHHWQKGLSKEEDLALRRETLASDFYLTSSNAITMDGELVNIDGTGNRIVGMIFGPPKVIVVAGMNKVVVDANEAIWRVKDVASPRNNLRLGFKLPCVQAGKCVDCDSPQRTCRVTVIMERRPSLTEITVVLVGEELGY